MARKLKRKNSQVHYVIRIILFSYVEVPVHADTILSKTRQVNSKVLYVFSSIM